MLPSEKIEVGIFKFITAVGRSRGVTISELSAALNPNADFEILIERLEDLYELKRIRLSKIGGGGISVSYPAYLGVEGKTKFFYEGSFVIEIAPQGRKYFEDIENKEKSEQVESAENRDHREPTPQAPISHTTLNWSGASTGEGRRMLETAFGINRDIHDWEPLAEIGEGGQSNVYLVRSPARWVERQASLVQMTRAVVAFDEKQISKVIWNAVRPDSPSELGALKIFKFGAKSAGLPAPPPGYAPLERLRNEIAALKTGLPGLPKLLDSDEDERWIITEYFPEKSLKHNLQMYRGQVIPALKAFRSLAQTVASLHAKGYVHRDIKPHNVYVRGSDLVLGDFGIIFMPDEHGRVTMPLERVGPRDYMPPWTNLGERIDDVRPTTDIYMLGKLLWSLVDGRIRLPYQYQKDPQFDLTVTFQGDPHMHFINQLLDRSVVEYEKDCTLTAGEMLMFADKMIQVAERGGQILRKDVPRPCRICGDGYYIPGTTVPGYDPIGLTTWVGGRQTPLSVYPFICSYCGHLEFFTKTPPGN
jgi:serine/threonine protein kinase